MRVSAMLALTASIWACTPKNKTDAADAAPSDQGPNGAASVTVDDKPFANVVTVGVLTSRAGERDLKTGVAMAIVTVTLETATHDTLLFDIPWRDGVTGESADARLTYVAGGSTYRADTAVTHVNVKKITQVDPQTYAYDAEFEIRVIKVAGSETSVVKGAFTGLRVKSMPKLLQRL